jgi:hypothetical protein
MNFINKKYSEEEEIRKIINKLSKDDWNYISYYQMLSEDFIREFQDKVYWDNISEYQTLSEDFIREFQNKVNWSNISFYQTLSEDFIREFKNKVDWYYIRLNENLKVSDKFCEDFDEKLCLYNIWRINGKYHRTLGPAISNEFWYRGQKAENISNMKQYKRWLKLRIFS